MTNPKHYSNIARMPREGYLAQFVAPSGAKDAPFPVPANGTAYPAYRYELVEPWWAEQKAETVWTRDGHPCDRLPNGRYRLRGALLSSEPLDIEWKVGHCTTEPPAKPEPKPEKLDEPTAPGILVRGTIDGETVRAVREGRGNAPWTLYGGRAGSSWLDWGDLLKRFDAAPTIIDTDQPTGFTDEQPKPCECRWCVAAERRDRMRMGGMVIAPCDEYGRTDREAKPSLTDEQHEAIRVVDQVLDGAILARKGIMYDLRAVFPEVFAEPDPTGGDPVIMAALAKGGSVSIFYRCEDGSWSRSFNREKGSWLTEDLYDVRRLRPDTIADLTGDVWSE